jgi:hypothetical protein
MRPVILQIGILVMLHVPAYVGKIHARGWEHRWGEHPFPARPVGSVVQLQSIHINTLSLIQVLYLGGNKRPTL